MYRAFLGNRRGSALCESRTRQLNQYRHDHCYVYRPGYDTSNSLKAESFPLQNQRCTNTKEGSQEYVDIFGQIHNYEDFPPLEETAAVRNRQGTQSANVQKLERKQLFKTQRTYGWNSTSSAHSPQEIAITPQKMNENHAKNACYIRPASLSQTMAANDMQGNVPGVDHRVEIVETLQGCSSFREQLQTTPTTQLGRNAESYRSGGLATCIPGSNENRHCPYQDEVMHNEVKINCMESDGNVELCQLSKMEHLTIGSGRPIRQCQQNVTDQARDFMRPPINSPPAVTQIWNLESQYLDRIIGYNYNGANSYQKPDSQFHNNERSESIKVSTGTQTESELIQNEQTGLYRGHSLGTLQIWFVPDYNLKLPSALQNSLIAAHGHQHSQHSNIQFPSETSTTPLATPFHNDSPPLHAGGDSALQVIYQVQQQYQVQLRQVGDPDLTSVSSMVTNVSSNYENVFAHSIATSTENVEIANSNADRMASVTNDLGNEFGMPSRTCVAPNDTINNVSFTGNEVDIKQDEPIPNNTSLQIPSTWCHTVDNVTRQYDEETVLEHRSRIVALKLLSAGLVPTGEPDLNLFPHVFQQPSLPSAGENQRHVSVRRKYSNSNDSATLTWHGQLQPKDTDYPRYSEKVFVGGIDSKVSREDLLNGFMRFGATEVSWCAMGGEKVIHGCAYVTLGCKRQVDALLRHCRPWISEVKFWKGQNTLHYDMPFQGRSIEVEVILWDVTQGVYNNSNFTSQNFNGNKHSVFIGNVHARFSAGDLAVFFNSQGFEDVICIRIGIDKTEYPVGFAKVTFASHQSFVKAVKARKFVVETPEFSRSLQIEPFIEANPCNMCNMERGNLFCRNTLCYKYYCENCYRCAHSRRYSNRQNNHSKELVTRGAGRRTKNFDHET